jgi:phage FluMu gp28-like protein
LLPYQRRWVDDAARFKLGVFARQCGKSFCTAEEAVEDSLVDAGTKWVCLSAGERQALEWLEKAKEWAEAFRLVIEEYAEDRGGLAEALLKAAEIRFANGSRIIAIPANPGTARGYSANIVLDEFAYHEDSDRIWAAMFPSVTNPLAGTFLTRVRALVKGSERDEARREMRVRVVSTFNGKDNKFYRLWERNYRPFQAASVAALVKRGPRSAGILTTDDPRLTSAATAERPSSETAAAGAAALQADSHDAGAYSCHLVTIHDAVRDGLPLDVAQLRAGLDDADTWAQEYECLPSDTSNVLLPYEVIALGEHAEATEVCDSQYWLSSLPSSNPVFCGIDFGRQNDPTVCWSAELIGDTLWTREVLVLARTDTPEQVAALRSRIRRAARVSLDYTGPGVGLGDYLAKEFGVFDPGRHAFGKIELCTFSLEFKREIFPKLRRKFDAPTKVRIPVSRTIREDLHALQQVVTNGQYNYWAPRTRDGHSDRCTALALCVRAAGEKSVATALNPATAMTIGSRRAPALLGKRIWG